MIGSKKWKDTVVEWWARALRMVAGCTLATGLAVAQEGVEPAEEGEPESDQEEKVTFERRITFDLTREQEEHFRRWLPNCYAKLSQRKPFHMVAVGDSIVEMYGYGEESGNSLLAHPGRFAEQLAHQFFYTGGVRLIRPNKGKPAKMEPHMGPEITYRALGRGGKMSIHAMQALNTYGFEHPPDLVIVSFGINDSTFGLDPFLYARALQQVIDTVKAAGGEVMLLGPTLTLQEPPEVGMATTRAYTDTMRQLAAENDVFFADLGDLAPLVTVPETLGTPAEVFDHVVDGYRRFFERGSLKDYLHPLPSLHPVLGRRVFKELINGPETMPWAVGSATAKILGDDRIEVEAEIRNASEESLNLVILPLVGQAWKPLEATPQLSLEPGASQVIKIEYKVRDDDSRTLANEMPSHESLLRLPVMICGAGRVRIETMRAELKPAVLLWKVETLFNQEKEFLPANLLMNTSDGLIEGEWEASWMGQVRRGSFKVESRGSTELPLRFDLPDTAERPFTQSTVLSVRLDLPTWSMTFKRFVDISRNFGLKELIPLMTNAESSSPSLPQLGDRSRSVTLRADADKDNLFLIYEVRGVDMADNPATSQAWFLTINLDARSYGKRLTPGSTDAIRIFGNAADGPGEVGGIQPWSFGDGYAARFEERHVKAVLGSGTENVRRFTVTIPRSYLYLHEWALGNGNSQLGINTSLQFWQSGKEGESGSFSPENLFSLIHVLHRDDAEGLVVLELTPQPTKRWSLKIH